MANGKRLKVKKKSRQKSEDLSRIIEWPDGQSDGGTWTPSPRGHDVPCVDGQKRHSASRGSEKVAREVHLAFLPGNYEPLEEEGDRAVAATGEASQKRREKCKKYRKNVGKALRFTWKCLMSGLQSFSMGYSMPLSAAATIIPDLRQNKQKE
ncbi:uncharacterized protein C1orf115 homolog [Denticeps clupeoides]|nr:uncharacterized protein C1orf115 homolog [Denticeps clupeoides]